jgi:adenosylhomocysteine nucleosidase
MPDRRRVAVLAALEEEAHALVRHLPRSETIGPRLSIWEGDRIVVVVGGVGKVAAALATQFTCDVFKPRSVISIGLAGALATKAKPGQVVVATRAMQHDLDGRPLTKAKGIIPALGIGTIPANPAVSDTLLRAARYKSEDAQAGLVLTGDQVVTSRAVRDALAKDFPDAACIDMETAAVAQVAYQNDVPWSGVRVISDSADETFDLKGVIGFGVDTAANLFGSIIQTVVDDL